MYYLSFIFISLLVIIAIISMSFIIYYAINTNYNLNKHIESRVEKEMDARHKSDKIKNIDEKLNYPQNSNENIEVSETPGAVIITVKTYKGQNKQYKIRTEEIINNIIKKENTNAK